MMDKTFIGLIKSQIDAIENSTSSAEANMSMLEAVKLLLDNVDTADETLSSYDKFGIRRLFAAYGDSGKKICAFYGSAKSTLDPAALNGTIGTTISETGKRIDEISTAFSELEEKEAELLKAEDELSALNEKYRSLSEKVATLKTVRETVTDEVIDALNDENKCLEKKIKSNKKIKDEADKENEKLKKLLADTEKIRTDTDAECRKIKSNILEIIDRNRNEIAALYENGSSDVDTMKAEIAEYIRLYEDLDSAVREYEQTRSFYEKWLGENCTIVENMRKYGVESLKQIIDAISSTKANAEYELKAYDTIIQKVITDEQNIRTAVERRQGKNV